MLMLCTPDGIQRMVPACTSSMDATPYQEAVSQHGLQNTLYIVSQQEQRRLRLAETDDRCFWRDANVASAAFGSWGACSSFEDAGQILFIWGNAQLRPLCHGPFCSLRAIPPIRFAGSNVAAKTLNFAWKDAAPSYAG